MAQRGEAKHFAAMERQKLLHHVERKQRGHPVEREALPHFGEGEVVDPFGMARKLFEMLVFSRHHLILPPIRAHRFMAAVVHGMGESPPPRQSLNARDRDHSVADQRAGLDRLVRSGTL